MSPLGSQQSHSSVDREVDDTLIRVTEVEWRHKAHGSEGD